ncbi:MAG: S8/S53 family peptidase [Bacteroidota bacterium]|nr:S8/S53 family peptidase [Bacteroidota bacterium]
MKKFLLLALLQVFCIITFAQTVQLATNGFDLILKPVDTISYAEYPKEGFTKRTFSKETFSGVNLKNSFGLIIKPKSSKPQETPVYSSKFYAYTDGTLQAPTTQLFFSPRNISDFITKYKNLGIIETHPSLEGYYFIYVSNEKYRTGESILSLCQELFLKKDVFIVEPVFIRLMKAQNPLRPWQWNIRNNANVPGGQIGADMGVENAWNINITGAGINVAVIDDGVDLTHPDLQGRLLAGFDATGNNSGGAPTNDNFHGTNCAGIIAAANNNIDVIGVAFNSNIIPIRMGIVNRLTNQFNTNDNWIVSCFNEAVNRGADIISNSWGGGTPSAQINAAIQNAVNNGRNGRGCVVLFSTGNFNRDIEWPSSNGNVIAVGASTPCDSRKRSSNVFVPGMNPNVQLDQEGTSCDGEFWWGSNFGAGLDILAPGVLITTTDNVGANGFNNVDFNDVFNGTSAACPNAAGVVALILSENPNLTGQQARNILEQTCFKIPNGNFQPNVAGQPNGTWSNQAGYGRVNAAAAVCMAVSQALTISGSGFICTSETYTINTNLPVTWAISPAGMVNLNSSGNQVTLTRVFDGPFTLTATVNNGCGVPINMQLLSGTTSTPSTYIIGGVPDNYSFCIGSAFNVYSTISPVPVSNNWSIIGGTITSGQGTPHINIQLDNTPGGYAIMLPYTDACGATRIAGLQGTKVDDGCQGSNTQTSAQLLKAIIYPNPTISYFTIVVPNKYLGGSIRLMTLNGQVIRNVKISNTITKVDVQSLTSGIYFTEIISKTGQTEKRKIIVAH